MSLRDISKLTNRFPELVGYETFMMAAPSLSLDNRKLEQGDVFIALQGGSHHGLDFASQAIKAGCGLILSDKPLPPAFNQKGVFIQHLRERLFELLACFYPHKPECLVAVTGTNGKTSTAHFLQQLWMHNGLKAASLGTLGLIIGDSGPEGGSLTSPDIITTYRYLDKAKQLGSNHLVLEASSHGLDQGRLAGLEFQAVAFSNLSQDHLDYHGTMDNYFAAKRKLFDAPFSTKATYVINRQDTWGETLASSLTLKRPLIDIGTQGFIRLLHRKAFDHGQILTLSIDGALHEVPLPLIGNFQMHNALLALGMALASGLTVSQALQGIQHLKGVNGRLEPIVKLASGGIAYVDFAHTPDALIKALQDIRPYCHGRLGVVFGAGGDRDPSKRIPMGEAATKGADFVYVTDDNPRFEDSAAIRSEIMKGAPYATEIGDRREAIAAALNELGSEDVLLVAGKGHESGQIVGDLTLPFNDRFVVREVAAELGLI